MAAQPLPAESGRGHLALLAVLQDVVQPNMALERGLHATSECPDDGDGSPADYGSCRPLLTWPRRSLAAPITSILKLMKSSNVSPGP